MRVDLELEIIVMKLEAKSPFWHEYQNSNALLILLQSELMVPQLPVGGLVRNWFVPTNEAGRRA